MSDDKSISYSSTGVQYEIMDPVKKQAQVAAKGTSAGLGRFGFKEVSESRGESAYVWDEGDSYKALVLEGLGTKSLVADSMYEITGRSYYDSIAQDVVASSVNDLIVVGASPMVINAYFGLGDSNWLKDEKRAGDLIKGWTNACEMAGATWGGGETPTLSGIINPETIDLGSSCIGIIKPKERLTLGDKLAAGDAILLIESSGIHANGLSLVRKIVERLPEGYKTKLPDGMLFGDAILKPTHIYSKLVESLFEASVEIHYMVHITGHGFRKIMRANRDFSYVIETLPTPQAEFDLIQKESGNSDEEMYGNFNMGTGFAIMLPKSEVEKAQKIAQENGFKSWDAGVVKEGPNQVVIKPKNIVFKAESLGVR